MQQQQSFTKKEVIDKANEAKNALVDKEVRYEVIVKMTGVVEDIGSFAEKLYATKGAKVLKYNFYTMPEVPQDEDGTYDFTNFA